MDINQFKLIGATLDEHLKKYNYQVSPKAPAGRPGKVVRNQREYRLQLINKMNDTSSTMLQQMPSIITATFGKNAKNTKYNAISPNSSKFPSYSLVFDGQEFDIIIARGANKGENFETKTVGDLSSAFKTRSGDLAELIELLNNANKEFASVEIKSVKQRTGSTKKENVPIEKLGEIIGDIVLEDTANKKWFISLKDINGDTISSYSGAASLFVNNELQPKSAGAEFLQSFGVDLNQVQAGFDERNNVKIVRPNIAIKKMDPRKIKDIFERAWGMNYFYVRRLSSGWKVFWLDKQYLDKLTNNMKIDEIRYPNKTSKQITILCSNSYQKYTIELRNSKAGEYPNDTKIKVRK